MPNPIRGLIGLLLLFAPFTSARGEGLVQLTLNGSLYARGGAPVEVQWNHWDGSEVVETHMRLHLAERTGAFDVAFLIASRLRARGARVLFPAEHSGRESDVHLFVEDTTLLSVRLGSGLWSRVTICEGAPESVRFSKPLTTIEGAQLSINTSMFNAHTKKAGGVLLELDIDGHQSPTSICEQLFQQGLSKGLICDRPSPDRWTPVRGTDGSSLTGCSIELLSPGTDWGLEVRLSVPQ